jgi:hypothetical protein
MLYLTYGIVIAYARNYFSKNSLMVYLIKMIGLMFSENLLKLFFDISFFFSINLAKIFV